MIFTIHFHCENLLLYLRVDQIFVSNFERRKQFSYMRVCVGEGYLCVYVYVCLLVLVNVCVPAAACACVFVVMILIYYRLENSLAMLMSLNLRKA